MRDSPLDDAEWTPKKGLVYMIPVEQLWNQCKTYQDNPLDEADADDEFPMGSIDDLADSLVIAITEPRPEGQTLTEAFRDILEFWMVPED